MAPIRISLLCAALSLAVPFKAEADITLNIESSGDGVRLVLDSQPGTNYQFQISTNLIHWEDWGEELTGDGLSRTQSVSTAGQPMAYFRVAATPAPQDIAPSDAEFTAAVVGETILDYTFLSATRFAWFDEPGNWDYTKTSGTTATLVFTYDEAENNPAIYREEILLTFDTPTSGSFRYSEYNGNVEDPSSITMGPFDLPE